MSKLCTVLALDLATKCGYALSSPSHAVMSGTWDLKPGRFSSHSMRFVYFRQRLGELREAMGGKIDQVFFEEVRRHAGTDAAHAYGGFMAILTAWCIETGIPYEGVPVGSIKKFATGKGNANKAAMIAAVRGWGFNPVDDNEADALALLTMKLEDMRGT